MMTGFGHWWHRLQTLRRDTADDHACVPVPFVPRPAPEETMMMALCSWTARSFRSFSPSFLTPLSIHSPSGSVFAWIMYTIMYVRDRIRSSSAFQIVCSRNYIHGPYSISTPVTNSLSAHQSRSGSTLFQCMPRYLCRVLVR